MVYSYFISCVSLSADGTHTLAIGVDESIGACWEAWASRHRDGERVMSVESTMWAFVLEQFGSNHNDAADALHLSVDIARGTRTGVEYMAYLMRYCMRPAYTASLTCGGGDKDAVLAACDRLADTHASSEPSDIEQFVYNLPRGAEFWLHAVKCLEQELRASTRPREYAEDSLEEQRVAHAVLLYALLLYRSACGDAVFSGASDSAIPELGWLTSALDARGIISRRWRAFAALLQVYRFGRRFRVPLAAAADARLKELLLATKVPAERGLLNALYQLYYTEHREKQPFSVVESHIRILCDSQMAALSCAYHRRQAGDASADLVKHAESGHWRVASADGLIVLLPASITSTPDSERYTYERVPDADGEAYGVDTAINSVWRLSEKQAPAVVQAAMTMPDYSSDADSGVDRVDPPTRHDEDQLDAIRTMYSTQNLKYH